MHIKSTSFGTAQTMLEKNGTVIAEHLTFDMKGRGHSHHQWEVCFVTEGSGTVFYGDEKIEVEAGDVCKIPPHTNHWMEPEPYMEALLVYTDNV